MLANPLKENESPRSIFDRFLNDPDARRCDILTRHAMYFLHEFGIQIDDVAHRAAAVRTGDEFEVLMKDIVAHHWEHRWALTAQHRTQTKLDIAAQRAGQTWAEVIRDFPDEETNTLEFLHYALVLYKRDAGLKTRFTA